ncbi:DUF2795 domain-containing protein [Streptomyces asoensis]|uniref:DUF2795 domain-containing protein n=1 Tax=Streptomyces TaxID=1883 RepID=UPI00190AA432|nr:MULTISPECIES: DUF2795 domain-containing protein [unclassified Streptomyces]MBK3624407.1 DUF2795 domain-containing protein [Streptomyces sp. MBT49]MBK3634106.1 DUF2795 domain-containing protein [Streptomyces sp. MBT97]
MQRGSDRLSVHRDDEMKHELQGLLRSGHPTRVEEWHDPEPSAEDDPEIWGGPVVPGNPGATLESVRLELARLLGRSSFPADATALVAGLRRKNAPDALVEAVRRLPGKDHYGNVQELTEALVGSGR